MILVDSSVVIDVTKGDRSWGEWSVAAMESAKATDDIGINGIIFAEISIGYASLRALESALETLGLGIVPIPREAFFLAGHAYKRYRERRGTKTGVLPDFIIGAHAAIARATLLTRDPDRVRAYFPTVALITP